MRSWLTETVLGRITQIIAILILMVALAIPLVVVLFYWLLQGFLFIAAELPLTLY